MIPAKLWIKPNMVCSSRRRRGYHVRHTESMTYKRDQIIRNIVKISRLRLIVRGGGPIHK